MTTAKTPTAIDLTREPEFSLGSLRVLPSSREVASGDVREALEPRVMQVLVALARRRGDVVSRDQLVAECWDGRVVGDDAINRCMVKIRRIAETHGEFGVETIPRLGYRLSVHSAAALESPVAATPRGPASNSDVAPASRRTFAQLFNNIRSWWIFAGATLIVVAAVVFNLLATREPPLHVRLAVLPFANLSPDPANAFFTDGLYDEVLTTLTNRAPDMDVISRTTMMRYRGAPQSVTTIVKELGPTHVLEGSVQREGQTVRVIVQLIDARDDKHLWARTFDRQLENVMSLQSQVATEVATQLAIKLAANNLSLPGSSNAQAYDLYLRAKLANQSVTQRTSREELDRMERWLSDAIDLDGKFAAAYRLRAQVRLVKLVYNHDATDENKQGAKQDIETALKLAGPLPAVLQVQSRYANIVELDVERALSLMNLPQARESKDPDILVWRAFQLGRLSRHEEALAIYEQVAALDPGNRLIFGAWGTELWFARRPAEALRVVQSYNEHGPGRIEYGDLEFSFTGHLERLRADLNRQSESLDANTKLLAETDVLRFEGRYRELNDLIDSSNLATCRHGGYRDYQLALSGTKPTAEIRGWAKLLIGDRAAAKLAARDVDAFVAKNPAARVDNVWLRLLAAEAQLFAGNDAEAVAQARAIVSSLPSQFIGARRFMALSAARIYAWAGAHEDAVEILEMLSAGSSGLGPAEITRDPLYSIPLKNHARYQSLEKKLEAEIAANGRLFGF